MARTDTLPNFLTDVADAIREKKGTEELIQASEFDTEIANIPTGSSEKLQPTLLTFANYQGTSIDVSNIDVSRMTTIGNMFAGCYNLEELDLSGFYTSNITAMNNTFQNCRSLQKLDIRNFDFTNVTNSNNMFSQVSSNCLVIVKGQTEKDWVLSKATLNVKTVAELE